MDMTREEAIDFLRNWMLSKQRVGVVVSLPNLKIDVEGLLLLQQDTLSVLTRDPATHVLITLRNAKYVYLEGRDAPQQTREYIEATYEGSMRIITQAATVQMFVKK